LDQLAKASTFDKGSDDDELLILDEAFNHRCNARMRMTPKGRDFELGSADIAPGAYGIETSLDVLSGGRTHQVPFEVSWEASDDRVRSDVPSHLTTLLRPAGFSNARS
jgi:hypothetical protein